MTPGVVVLLAAVGLALCLGTWRLLTDGRFRGTHAVRGIASPEPAETVEPRAPAVLEGTAYAERLGERATLVQFSSAFCAPCRATRQLLADVTGRTPGVVHLEIDAEQNLALVRRVGVTRTPTTVLLDPQGSEVLRASGVPRRDQLTSALSPLVDPE